MCQLQPGDLTPASLLNGPQANHNNRLRLPAALNFNLNLCSIELPEEKKKKLPIVNLPVVPNTLSRSASRIQKQCGFFFFLVQVSRVIMFCFLRAAPWSPSCTFQSLACSCSPFLLSVSSNIVQLGHYGTDMPTLDRDMKCSMS